MTTTWLLGAVRLLAALRDRRELGTGEWFELMLEVNAAHGREQGVKPSDIKGLLAGSESAGMALSIAHSSLSAETSDFCKRIIEVCKIHPEISSLNQKEIGERMQDWLAEVVR